MGALIFEHPSNSTRIFTDVSTAPYGGTYSLAEVISMLVRFGFIVAPPTDNEPGFTYTLVLLKTDQSTGEISEVGVLNDDSFANFAQSGGGHTPESTIIPQVGDTIRVKLSPKIS